MQYYSLKKNNSNHQIIFKFQKKVGYETWTHANLSSIWLYECIYITHISSLLHCRVLFIKHASKFTLRPRDMMNCYALYTSQLQRCPLINGVITFFFFFFLNTSNSQRKLIIIIILKVLSANLCSRRVQH